VQTLVAVFAISNSCGKKETQSIKDPLNRKVRVYLWYIGERFRANDIQESSQRWQEVLAFSRGGCCGMRQLLIDMVQNTKHKQTKKGFQGSRFVATPYLDLIQSI
jgi:hypothetical protein